MLTSLIDTETRNPKYLSLKQITVLTKYWEAHLYKKRYLTPIIYQKATSAFSLNKMAGCYNNLFFNILFCSNFLTRMDLTEYCEPHC